MTNYGKNYEISYVPSIIHCVIDDCSERPSRLRQFWTYSYYDHQGTKFAKDAQAQLRSVPVEAQWLQLHIRIH